MEKIITLTKEEKEQYEQEYSDYLDWIDRHRGDYEGDYWEI